MVCTFTHLLVATILVVGSSHFCSAQVSCSGTLSGNFTNGVKCTSSVECILDGAIVSGSVECSSGTLLAKGNSLITGNILLNGLVTRAELGAVTVLGAVQVKAADSLLELVINDTATINGLVLVEDTPGDVFAAGSLGGLSLINSGDLFVNSLSTIATLSVLGGDGIIRLCGSLIGGLTVQQHIGDIEIDANSENCALTTFTGGISATKGSGNVIVRGAVLSSGDIIMSEYTGDAILQELQLSDIKFQTNTGSITIVSIVADSDSTITGQVGDVELNDLSITGDFAVNNLQGSVTLTNNLIITGDFVVNTVQGSVTLINLSSTGDFAVTFVEGNVTLRDSDFALEDVSILQITGAVTVERNINLSLSVVEISGSVQIADNVIANGNVNKNTGGVLFLGNIFDFLSCTDNNPAPSGSSNTIGFGDGQCASGL